MSDVPKSMQKNLEAARKTVDAEIFSFHARRPCKFKKNNSARHRIKHNATNFRKFFLCFTRVLAVSVLLCFVFAFGVWWVVCATVYTTSSRVSGLGHTLFLSTPSFASLATHPQDSLTLVFFI